VQENLRDPLGQNWDFFNPLAKNRYFPYPPRTQNRIFLSDIFLSILPPSDSFFNDCSPLGHFFNNFTPLGHFFFRPPSDKKCSFLPPRSKTRIFSTPPRTWRFDPLGQKGHFLPHPFFFNGIALRLNG